MKKGITITVVGFGILYSLGVMSNIEGSLNFIARLTNIKIEKMIELLQISYKLISISFPFLIGLCLYKIYDLIEKQKALKKFRDAESIFLTNRFNEAISALSEAKGISNEYDTKADEVYQTFSKSISEYNEAFKSWGIGEYGIGDNTTAKKRN
jgi:hypothetical protein